MLNISIESDFHAKNDSSNELIVCAQRSKWFPKLDNSFRFGIY